MRLNRRLSLRGQLALGFLAVVTIVVTVATLIAQTNPLVRFGFTAISQPLARQRAYQFGPMFVWYYEAYGSWAGVEELTSRFGTIPFEETVVWPAFFLPYEYVIDAPLTSERVVLLDVEGRVMLDTADELPPGSLAPRDIQAQTIQLRSGDDSIGGLTFAIEITAESEELLSRLTTRTLSLAAVASGLMGVGVSLGLAQYISSPLRRLSQEVEKFADGRPIEPLPVGGSAEMADLMTTFNTMTTTIAEQQQARRQMVADIAHELRTPLSVMQLEVEALSDSLQAPDEAARTLTAQIATLTTLIEDLRTLSLSDAGGLTLTPESVDLAAFLSDVVQVWQRNTQKVDITLTLNVSPDLPSITVDPTRLRQVVINLLTNAIRHTPAGGTIHIAARPTAEGVRLTVSDTGEGISSELLPRLFDRFTRGDESRARSTGGSGLGLAIVKAIVEAHNGTVTAHSDGPGHGTRFVIDLPYS